jgi:hypothetical protein
MIFSITSLSTTRQLDRAIGRRILLTARTP